MDVSFPTRIYTESVLYDDLVDILEIDNENKCYTLSLNCKSDVLNNRDVDGRADFMLFGRDTFDIVLNAVKEQFLPGGAK